MVEARWFLIESASVFVIIHFGCEFFHYIYEFFSSRKEKDQLEDIHRHVECIEKRIEKVEENGSKQFKKRSRRLHTMRFARR